LFASSTALLAPRPDFPPPPARAGIAIAGEFTRSTGLSEAARLMRRALDHVGLPVWAIDLDDADATGAEVPPGAPLLLHVNSPLVPLALLRAPRSLVRGRRVRSCAGAASSATGRGNCRR
jgi:hypothetical protein